MSLHALNLKPIHASWRPYVEQSLAKVAPQYLRTLEIEHNWLPGPVKIFNAFSLPLPQTQYILFGESPYPRAHSANGYAFWDANTHELWSTKGLSTQVNRATSLRNFVKMLLVANHYLKSTDTSQPAIAHLDKTKLIRTTDELFLNLQQNGVLLLNATLVYSPQQVRMHARNWQPFQQDLLAQLAKLKPTLQLILLGNIAHFIEDFPSSKQFKKIIAPHPYNLSFINNAAIHHLFAPMQLLIRK